MGSERGRDPGKGVGWVDVVIWRLRGGLFCLGIGLSWGQGLLGEYRSLLGIFLTKSCS